MGCCCKVFISLFALVGVLLYFTLFKESTDQLPSNVYDDHYWGEKVLKDGEPLPKDETLIRALKVTYDEEVVRDLHQRLDKTRFVEPLPGRNFRDGFNGDYLKKVVHYWRNKFDWKKQVDYLNQHPQFTTQIEGLTIHFVRIRPLGTAKVVKPILLVNGWPSNYHHFYGLADRLRKAVDDVAFEVVLVSRPGFGYSERPHRDGFSLYDSARIYVKLMKRLGYERFYYAGEDWGAIEAHALSVLYADNLEGVHFSMTRPDLSLKGLLRMTIGAYLPSLIYSDEFEAKTFANPIAVFKTVVREIGYFMIQSTKPETIGALLADSPAGLAAYYLEKFSAGVNPDFIRLPDGGLTKKFTLDELLTNIMIYWTTGHGAYSVRYYHEYINNFKRIPADPKVPCGFTVGEHEVNIFKMKPVGRYNIVKFDYLYGVGHFPSSENPDAVAEHLRKFVSIVMEKNEKSKNTEL